MNYWQYINKYNDTTEHEQWTECNQENKEEVHRRVETTIGR